jgi:3',5'-cyclic AMP phosphodiesterase CpdA
MNIRHFPRRADVASSIEHNRCRLKVSTFAVRDRFDAFTSAEASDKPATMFTLAHLTDLHLGPLPAMRRRDLASKRLFGYVNWRGNRGHGFDDRILAALVDDIRARKPDHIVVTGDLVNLALREEFVAAHDWLSRLGPPDRVTVIPGNHDAYVPGAFQQIIEIWRDFMTGDGEDGEFARFPFVRRRGPVAIVALSSAVATAPLMATGRIGADQASALGAHLSALAAEGRFRIVLIHHPPIAGATAWTKRLIGAGLFRAEIARHGAELVLHGHNHHTNVARLAGSHADVPVVGAAAAAITPRLDHPGGSYNLFRIGGAGGDFTCTMVERGILRLGDTVETLSEQVLTGAAA